MVVWECYGRTVRLNPWELWEQMLVEEYYPPWILIQSTQTGGKEGSSTELQAQLPGDIQVVSHSDQKMPPNQGPGAWGTRRELFLKCH